MSELVMDTENRDLFPSKKEPGVAKRKTQKTPQIFGELEIVYQNSHTIQDVS